MTPWGEMDTHRHAPGLLEWAGGWSDHVIATYKPIKTAWLFWDEGSDSSLSLWYLLASPILVSHTPSLSMVLGISFKLLFILPTGLNYLSPTWQLACLSGPSSTAASSEDFPAE